MILKVILMLLKVNFSVDIENAHESEEWEEFGLIINILFLMRLNKNKHLKVELSQVVSCFDKEPIVYNHIPSKHDENMMNICQFDYKRSNQESSLCKKSEKCGK